MNGSEEDRKVKREKWLETLAKKEESKLIPYSVYLPRQLHTQLKEKARHHKASKLVRDALKLILENKGPFNAGYRQAIRDVQKVFSEDRFEKEIIGKIGSNLKISESINEDLQQSILNKLEDLSEKNT